MKKSIILILLSLLIQVSCKKKEDLSSFFKMNSKIEKSIEVNSIANSTLLGLIYSKAKNDDSYINYKESADKVHEISTTFSNYLQGLKSVIKEKNSTEFVDEYFFNDVEIASGGEEFLNYIQNYKSNIIAIIGLSNPTISGMVKGTFDISSIEDHKGKQTDWLTLNYKSFPTIVSIIKLSEIQADVKRIEKSFYEAVLNVKLKREKKELTSNNNQVAVNTIKEKDLTIPVKTEVKETPKKEVKVVEVIKNVSIHTVAKGETIYMISKKYGITTSNLKKMNGMTNNTLVIGQKVKVKN